MKRKIDYICAECGGAHMIFDVTASWNAGTQSYEVESEYDHTPVCSSDECEGEERDFYTVDAETRERVEWWMGSYILFPEYEREIAARNERWKAELEERKALDAAYANGEAMAAGYDA